MIDTDDLIARESRCLGQAPKPYYSEAGITIYHSDCRDVLPNLTADVLVTDPPYGLAFSQGRRVNGQSSGWTSRWTNVAIAGDGDTAIRDAVLAWWGDRPALVFGSWKVPMPPFVREVLVWDKVVSTGMGDLDIPWRPSWESIYVIGRGFIGPRGHGVLRYSLPTLAVDRQWHPTPKPVELMRALLSKCPDEWTILDPFMGAGATLRAAKDLGRQAIGIEIDERYCEIAANRLRQQVLPLEAIA